MYIYITFKHKAMNKIQTSVYNFNLILAKINVKNRLHLQDAGNSKYILSVCSRITSLNPYIPEGRQSIIPLSSNLTSKQAQNFINLLSSNIFDTEI